MAQEISAQQAGELLNKQAKMINGYQQRLANADMQNVSLAADNEILTEQVQDLQRKILELQTKSDELAEVDTDA
jgi:hypothetical protein